MQQNKPVQILRYLFVIAFLLVICSVFCARLVSLQLIEGPDESLISEEGTYKRVEKLTASRGEIFDRNGVALVTNDYSRSIVIDYGDLPWTAAEVNNLILSSVKCIASVEGEESLCVIEHFPFTSILGDVSYKENYLEGGDDDFRLTRMLKRYEKPEDTSASDFLSYLLTRWKLVNSDGSFVYSEEDTYLIVSRRFDMDYKNFGPDSPYILCEDASIRVLSSVLELNLRGISTTMTADRVYMYPGYMSHILGKTGKIPAEQADKYKELGYSMDATVGVSGVELAYEEYLHGIDGEITIIEDMDGNIIEQCVSREPQPGRDVYLTIDIKLQQVAEDSLAYRIKDIAKNGGTKTGADCDSGAIVALDPKTNGVLAIASYPTYDLSTFDEDYAQLVEDEKSPLVNRALNSKYAPGSTFKLCTGLAALSEGKITQYTTIRDRGIYAYYADYQPHCWVYDMNGGTHGVINVAQAIEHSCNYFFFDVGRIMGIDTLDRYASALGLGQKSGIELPEDMGVLASPDYVETSGIGLWMPGDTLQASIGQSYHNITPIQLACYLSAIVNYGTRYSAHLLLDVRNFATGEVVYSYENKVMDGCIELDRAHVETVKYGMRLVMNQYLTKQAFKNLTEVQAVGKTGTAQIGGNHSDNATFVSFAPYADNVEPEIVIAGIIENGVSGNNTAYVVSDIMEQYFQGEAKIG